MHGVDVPQGCALRTLYVATEWVAIPWRCQVFSIPRLGQMMMVKACDWGGGHQDPVGEHFHRALVGLAVKWCHEQRLDLRLPRAQSPEVAAAMRWTEANLVDATVDGAAKAAGMSTRTLARRFAEETGDSWRGYLAAARMLNAWLVWNRVSR